MILVQRDSAGAYRVAKICGLFATVALIAAACGDSDSGDAAAPAGGAAATDVCPSTIVLQTNWFPEAEHGGTYQLIGADGVIDAENGTYTGPLADTGLQLEIRTGSQFIGFQPVTSVMYQDPDIFFGYIALYRKLFPGT